MTAPVPTSPSKPGAASAPPVTMFGPDFPFAYDDWIRHPAGLGQLPVTRHGTEVAVIGAGIAGLVAAYELMKLGLKPVIYESAQIGGRLRSQPFVDHPDSIAELGAMRFPPSATSFYDYVKLVGLETRPFPNPLSPATPSTVIELKNQSWYARQMEDLPEQFQRVARAWSEALEGEASFAAMQKAIGSRDVARIKAIWNPLVPIWDERTFYGFVAGSPSFRSSFKDREIFGQVGFGTGGWDTDFPCSMLEILRVVYMAADENQQSIVGGCQELPRRLWQLAPEKLVHWPRGTSLASLNEGFTHSGVTAIRRGAAQRIAITDSSGETREYPAAITTTQVWLLSNRIDCAEGLFSAPMWTAMEKTHYMQASKTFVLVDRPFWRDIDPATGRHVMSMTLTDRVTRGTYLMDQGEGKPGVICLSYAWNDDSLKWLPLPAEERVRIMLHSLAQIYPGLDIRRHIVSQPITVSWESDPHFMGAFKGNLPGHYRYQHRLFCHFMQGKFAAKHRGLFLAGDDISWTAGWAEGAVQTGLNAVWGVLRHLGGATHAENPGPGDRFAELAPIALEDN
jgi:lysine 2-monooxygenase